MTCRGVVKNGAIILDESATLPEGCRIIVTVLDSGVVDLQQRGIDLEKAGELRARLGTFVEDWEDPAMHAYDNYDVNKSAL